jgi:hypothetical protein
VGADLIPQLTPHVLTLAFSSWSNREQKRASASAVRNSNGTVRGSASNGSLASEGMWP